MQVIETSATQLKGLKELEEALLLQAELQELRASPLRSAEVTASFCLASDHPCARQVQSSCLCEEPCPSAHKDTGRDSQEQLLRNQAASLPLPAAHDRALL